MGTVGTDNRERAGDPLDRPYPGSALTPRDILNDVRGIRSLSPSPTASSPVHATTPQPPVLPRARTLASVALALVPIEEGAALPDAPHAVIYERAMELVLALAAHSEELRALPKGSLELHWGPGGVTAHLHSQWDPATTPALYATLALEPPTPSPDARRRGRAGGRGGKRPAPVAATTREVTIRGDEEVPWTMPPTTPTSTDA